MFIQTEKTPNPSTLKFIPGRTVLNKSTAFFKSRDEAISSPFAQRLFKVEGIKSVFFGSDFITISKDQSVEWDILKPLVLGSIMDHYSSEEEIIVKSDEENNKKITLDNDTKVIKQIKELLETRVRPAVAMDGGDIVFEKFEDGIVYLHMQGACSGCPSSIATLKSGIENMLKHYIPDIVEVRPIDK